jgi:hypothetical protein
MSDAVTEALVDCFGYDVGMAIDAQRAVTWKFGCGDVSLAGRTPGTVHHSSHFALQQHVFYKMPGEVEVDFFFVLHRFGERLHSISVTVGESAWHSECEPFRLTVEDHTFVCGSGMRMMGMWTRAALVRCLARGAA